MRPLRRTEHDARVEIMPLIDVVFLLLTFFIYAMVLMVRAEVLPVPLESYAHAAAAEPRPAVTITLAVDGELYVGRSRIEQVDLVSEVRARLDATPGAALYLVMEDGSAIIDRGPLLTATWDALRGEGLEIFLVGAPGDP